MTPIASVGWPVLDRIHLFGPIAISPHGLFIAIGFLAGAWWMLREGPKRGVSAEHINTMLFWALVGAIVGARLFYVIAHFSEFAGIGDMLSIWRGGISLLGGITGAILINLPLIRKYGYRFFQVMDSAAIGMAFGIFVGRTGDLIIGDHLGKPTSWLLAWTYRGGNLAGFDCVGGQCAEMLQGNLQLGITRAGATMIDATGQPIAQGVGVHQTALYDMISALFLFLFLYWLNKKPRREGVLFCSFLIWYGCTRIVEDFLRVDKRFFGLTGSQWTSIAAITVSVVLLVKWAIDAKRHPEAAMGPAPTTEFVPPREPSAGPS